jgi:uncharacterized protein (DUF1501 family)
MFLVGGGLRGGLYGTHPVLDRLDNGDAIYTVDFRSVYTTIIEKWFDRSTQGVIAGTFPILPLLG